MIAEGGEACVRGKPRGLATTSAKEMNGQATKWRW